MITEQHRKLTTILIGSFEQRASQGRMNFRHCEELKNETQFSREKQVKKIGVELSQPDKGDLPNERHVISVDSYTLLVLPMSLKEETFEADFQKAIWWAALIRSNLPLGIEDDLHLLIVGPPESGKDENAKFRAEFIEQDERFCRKFVWLPQSIGDETPQDFIDRTFMARPWDTLVSDDKIEQLSAVAAFLNRATHPSIPTKTIKSWLEVASAGEQSGRDLANTLLSHYKFVEEK